MKNKKGESDAVNKSCFEQEGLFDILNNSINEIFIFNPKTLKIISVNETGLQNVQYLKNEISQLFIYDLKPFFSKKQFVHLLNPLFDKEVSVIKHNTFHVRKDGSTYPVSVKIIGTKLNGENVGCCIAVDITNQLKTEITFNENETRYKQFIDNSNEGIGQIKFTSPLKIEKVKGEEIARGILSKGQFSTGNNQLKTLLKVDSLSNSTGFLLGRFFKKLLLEEYDDSLELMKFFVENNFEIKDVTFSCQTNSKPIKYFGVGFKGNYKDGHLYDIWIVVKDISERVRANLLVTKSEERYRNLFKKMNEGLLFCSSKGVIQFVNPQFEKMVGYSNEELIGENWYDFLVNHNEIQQNSFNLGNNIKSRNIVYDTRVLTKKGKTIWVKCSVSSNFRGVGKTLGFMNLITDITKQKMHALRQEVTYNLAKISNKLVLDIPHLTNLVQIELEKVMCAKNSFVALFDEQSNTISYPYFKDNELSLEAQKAVYANRKYSTGIVERIIETKQTILLSKKEIERDITSRENSKEIKKSPVALLGAPIKSNGQINGVIGVYSYLPDSSYSQEDVQFFDYTAKQISHLFQRVKDQSEIFGKEEKFHQLFSKVQEGLMFSDAEGIIKVVNQSFCKMVGYTEKELIGEDGYKTFHPATKQVELKSKIKQREEGLSEKYELEFITKKGNTIWTEVSSSPNIDEEGDFIGVMTIIVDITNRKEKEKELQNVMIQLQKSKDKYKRLVSESPVGILLLDSHTKIIVDCNNTFAKILGYKIEELQNKNLHFLTSEKSFEDSMEKLFSIKSNNNSVFQATCLHKDGSKVSVEVSLTEMLYKNEASLIIFNVIDITKRRKAEIDTEIAFSITTKANEKDLSTFEFCQFIHQKMNKVMDATNFFIAQDVGNDSFSFPYVQYQDFNNKLPFIRKKGNVLSKQIIDTGKALLLKGNEITLFLKQKGLEVSDILPKCWVGAPIYAKGNAIGVIACQSYAELDAFTQEHLKTLALVGSCLGSFFERKEQQRDLIYNKNRFQSLVENSSEITCILDEKGIIRYMSSSTSTVLGYHWNELKGKNIFDYFHDDEKQQAIADFAKKKNKKERGDYKVYRFLNKKGEWRYIRIVTSNQIDNPSICGYVINAQDVTEMQDIQQRLKTEHENALKYQSMLLSSQLNPHFIFNSLNSIQYYILERDPEPALLYLSNFAILMRSVLDNSTKELISLEQEIKFLNVYLELEETRHRGKFKHQISCSKSIDVTDTYVPPMLLQPYIENTVIHGVGNLAEGGVIKIHFKRFGKSIHCTIEDNGVGRQRAHDLKSLRSGKTHNSFSTEINTSRLGILNKLVEEKYAAKIEDLFDKKGNPRGTRVTAIFPRITEDD